MSKFKGKIGKRIMAVLLSGAMVMSGMISSDMTAFAAESSDNALTDIANEYYEETVKTADEASDDTHTETSVEIVSEVTETVITPEEAKTETIVATETETTVTPETETAALTQTATETETTAAAETETTTAVETATVSEESETAETETETAETEVETATEIESETEKVEAEENVSVSKNAEGKIDVYDFGAEVLDESIYNNVLTEKIINSWYPGVDPGTMPKNIASWKVTDDDGNLLLEFSDGGNASTHRIRTINKNITRYDEKSLEFGGITYKGYIYSNASKSDKVYLGVQAEAGDILTFAASANTTSSVNTYTFESPSGEKITQDHTGGNNKGTVLTFYAKESGEYKLYTLTEKLVVARITVEDTKEIPVTGTVTAPDGLKSKEYSVVFTNQKSGAQTEAKVTGGKYTTTLNEQYGYDVSLKDANGFIVTSGMELAIAKDEGYVEHDITVKDVNLVTVTGNITGISEADFAKLKLSFESEEIFIPEPAFEGTKYSVQLESGVSYKVVADGMNDYFLKTETISATEDNTTTDIIFEKKPVYPVTIEPKGASLEELANAKFVFTNLDEEGYKYTFTGTGGIELRDGVYSVKVQNCTPYSQVLTSNLKVEGAAVTKQIGFEIITAWDFGADDFKKASPSDIKEGYKGLLFSNVSVDSKGYAIIANGVDENKNVLPGTGTIKIPVNTNENLKIIVTYLYNANVKFENEETPKIVTADGSTSKTHTAEYIYAAGSSLVNDGYVTLTHIDGKVDNNGTEKEITKSYLTKIEVKPNTSYKASLTVGKEGYDYTTINEAVKAASLMDRPNGERVTIEIQPGDYEEMLVVNTPNITLKNANANPSIKPINKGVDIEASSVRITSYYGHGYTYYSMGNDCQYDSEILAKNKENGYASFVNPGSGTTSGSYWNATVSINADGFEADGIIFENSFNQYISKKAADDVIVKQSGAKEGTVPRAEMEAGSTKVQEKDYVERAAALAIYNNIKKVSFNNCSFIGRQDTLYGGTDVTAAFYDCDVYGGTDYIFGGMTAVFAKCDLVFNTNDQTDAGKKNDVGYITAPQQKSGRGYLMYNCRVTSTEPGVNTASEKVSKPGYFGRPWQGKTSEVVFYNTIVGQASNTGSLIEAIGWNSSLGGTSDYIYEYGTYEMVAGVDNSASRAAWSKVLTEPVLADGTEISVAAFLGDWDAFAGKNMEIVIPAEKVEGITISTIPASEYTGKAYEPAVEVKKGAEVVSADKYTVSYSNNVSAYIKSDAAYASKNMPTATVTMNDDGSKFSKSFEITPISLTDKRVKVAITSPVANGKEQYVNPVVMFDEKEILAIDKDYTLDYPSEGDYIKTGKYKVLITASKGGNFSGSVEADYEIIPEDGGSKTWVTKAKVTLPRGTKYTYTGKAQQPVPESVMVGSESLTYGKDYIIKYISNVNAGKATMVVVGTGNYIGLKSQTFNIAKANLKDTEVKYDTKNIPVYSGDGNMLKDLSITLAGYELKVNKDYNVSYKYKVDKTSGNLKVTMTVKAAGINFTGSIKETFDAKPIDLEAAIKATDPNEKLTYDMDMKFSNAGARVTGLAIGSNKLTEGIDYKVKYKNNKKMTDTPEVTITGINGCKGTVSLTGLKIVKSDLKDTSISVDYLDYAKVVKSGFKKTKIVVTDYAGAKLKEGKDFTVTWVGANVSSEDYSKLTLGEIIRVKLSPVSENYTGSKICSVRLASDIKKKMIIIKPQTITDDGVTLDANDFKGRFELGKDFRIVEYKNNFKTGNATVTIEGINKYYGSKTLKFKIVNPVIN